jgi:hypothetical protein
MAQSPRQPKKMSTGKKVAIGAGLALAAAAATYFLSGERGKKNRKAIKDWAVKANEEVAQAVKKAGDVTKVQYDRIVKDVMNRYQHLSENELKELGAMLKSHWKNFSK